MKTSLLASGLTVALLLNGCADQELRRSVKSIAVDPNVANRHKGYYTSASTTTIAVLGFVGIGVLPSMGIRAGIAAGPKTDMARAAAGGSETLEKMTLDAFLAEIPRSGSFALAKPNTGDATFELTVDRFGLDHHRPTVIVRARLMKNGECLFDSTHQGKAPDSAKVNIEDTKTNPAAFLAGWKLAVADAARLTMEDLLDEFGLPPHPAVPPPLPPAQAAVKKR